MHGRPAAPLVADGVGPAVVAGGEALHCVEAGEAEFAEQRQQPALPGEPGGAVVGGRELLFLSLERRPQRSEPVP